MKLIHEVKKRRQNGADQSTEPNVVKPDSRPPLCEQEKEERGQHHHKAASIDW